MPTGKVGLCALLTVGLMSLPVPVGAQSPITLGYTGANDFLAAFVASDQGFFKKRGLDVTLTRIANGSTIPAAMIGGSITVGGITPTLFMQANDSGLELKILAIASLQSSKNPTASVIVRKGVVVSAPGDFAGKKVGAPGLNSVMHAMFVRWLLAKGVDPAKVTFVETAMPQIGDLLKAGQIDAGLPVEPFRSRIVEGGVGTVYANFFAEMRDNVIFSFYVVTAEWAAKHPQDVKGLREALDEALAFIRTETQEARKSQAAHLGLPPQIVENLPLATYETKVDPAEVQFWLDLSRELGLVTRPLAVKDMIVE